MGIQIYKASAGSGKTYTLVYEYIKYLFKALFNNSQFTIHNSQLLTPSDTLVSLKNGDSSVTQVKCRKHGEDIACFSTFNLHRGILAVTFTNKATAEMKERIVKALYELSKGEREDYVKKLREGVPALKEVEDEVIAKMADRFLIDILQDYTQFRVSTIDGFFQQIVRSFARELNLNNQYQVELETDKVLEMAVDNMLSSLGDDNAQLLDWLTEFASEKVEEGGAWNPRNAILGLANLILKEDYLSQKEKLGFDLKRLKEYRDNIRGIIRKFD